MHPLKKIKIELWLIYLAILFTFIFLIGFSALVRHGILAKESRFPILSNSAVFISEIPSNFRDIVRGESFNIQSKEQRFNFISGFDGKPVDKEIYLLLSRYDGNINRSRVELIDLRTFKTIKSWSPNFSEINNLVNSSNDEFKDLNKNNSPERYMMTHPYMTDDGGLIFQDTSPLVMVDKDGKLIWQNQEDQFHHSIEQDHEGNFWVPTRIFPYEVDEKYVGTKYGNFFDDGITKISETGEILFQKSVSNILIENNMKYLLFSVGDGHFSRDPIHLNDIQPVLSDGKYWKKGDIFLSLRHHSMIALYRPSNNKIIWHDTGNTAAQHDINILDGHRISIFNNNSKQTYDKKIVDGNNEILIYDFSTNSYSEYMSNALKTHDVRTITEGRATILSNGDLFIEETDLGRLLFFNNDSSLQWQYVNTNQKGDVYVLKWSRILHDKKDLLKIQKILDTSDKK